MRKIILIITVLFLLTSIEQVNAETNDEFYAIQLGVHNNERLADDFIKKLAKEGLDAYKISTSVHSVFYGRYTSQEEASQDLNKVRRYVKSAYVVKLTEKQKAIYLNTMGDTSLSSTLTTKSIDSIKDKKADDKEVKRVTINKTKVGYLKYTYRVVDDIELRGIKGESKWFFNVDKNLKVINFKFNLYCRISELIKMDNSYFTVYINDIPIKSMRIKNAKNNLLNNWEINIPAGMIKRGYNELKVRTNSRITDNPCEDDKNIGNWVIIDGSTNYVITYNKVLSSSDISDFARPFVGMYADEARGIGVVVPDDYNDKEISAAVTLIAHMKSQSSGYEVPATLVTTSDQSILKFDSIIYIGNYSGVPEGLKNDIKNQASLYIDNANIYESTLDNGRKPVLLIVSDNGDRLMEAVKAINNSDLKAQMSERYVKLLPDIDTTIKEQRASDYIYLNDLGMSGIEVNGSNKQVANIGIRIPSNQVLANEANITLKTRYSDNLDFEKSCVSVYVNGIPIGSQKLERDKRELDTITFHIPYNLRQNFYYDVRIVFELIPNGIIDCERYLSSVPWAYINEDSYYYFPRQERRLMLLHNLPFPFSRNDDLDLTTIVLPDHPGREDFRIAGKIAKVMGTGLKNNRGYINVVKGNSFNEKYYGNNLAIFGTPKENSAIRTFNKYLWFKYNKQFNDVLSNEKLELLPKTSKTDTFLELKESPYNKNKGVMTITSQDKDSIIKAIDYLGDNRKYLLTGDAAIISKDGELLNFRFQKDQDERPIIGKTQETNKNMRDYFIFTGLLVLFLIISLGLYIYKKRQGNR